jgi:DNA-binding winged helix-turn-helix (wHTH) protein
MRDRTATPARIRFGPFEVCPDSKELRKNGTRLKLSNQAIEILLILVGDPGRLATREQLKQTLWPDASFGDFNHGLNVAVNRLREALGDSAENPRFVETLPRKGYRFIAPVNGLSLSEPNNNTQSAIQADNTPKTSVRWSLLAYWASAVMVISLAIVSLVLHNRNRQSDLHQRTLTRVTFDSGLQMGATWSPDGRLIAYSSDRGGKFDIWLQQVSGGDPVQVTHGPSQNWQPDWSPDGRYIAYRSEEGEGGIYVIPALGGAALMRKIAPFGYYPRWSPDGSQILFRTTQYLGLNRFYVVGLEGGEPREVLTQFHTQDGYTAMAAAWYPDGKRISAWTMGERTPDFWTVDVAGVSL